MYRKDSRKTFPMWDTNCQFQDTNSKLIILFSEQGNKGPRNPLEVKKASKSRQLRREPEEEDAQFVAGGARRAKNKKIQQIGDESNQRGFGFEGQRGGRGSEETGHRTQDTCVPKTIFPNAIFC